MEGLAHNANPTRRKLQGYEFYREMLGSPRYVVAPMVDQSELVRGLFNFQVPLSVLIVCRLGGYFPDDTVLK